MEIIYKVKDIRQKRGLTIRALALKSGVSKSEISDIERGEIHPTVYTLCLLANTLQVDARCLFTYEVSEMSDNSWL